MAYISFTDTTLRDGEQTPGAHFSVAHKAEAARALARFGVDVIEAGFPAASQGDFRAVVEVGAAVAALEGQLRHDVVVSALARALVADVDAAAEALRGVKRSRIHVFIATSDVHMREKLCMSRARVLGHIREAVARARQHTSDVEFSPEDGSRTDPDFLLEVARTAVEAGATTFNLPDTVGWALPDEFGALVAKLRAALPDSVALSVHCHNDLGLAAANTLAAIKAGATAVECTANGIGERAGNAALEEIALAAELRGDALGGATHGLDLTALSKLSRLISTLSGIDVAPNKAIVGKNVFRHESGIHQHGVMKNPATYEIIDPARIGAAGESIVLGKLSGRHAFMQRAVALGYALSDADMDGAFASFKDIADRKKDLTDSDVAAIINEYLDTRAGRYKLIGFQIQSCYGMKSMAMITLRDNTKLTCEEDKAAGVGRASEAAIGEGPVDAAFNAVDRLTIGEGVASLESYELRAVTEGADALGEVFVRIRIGDAVYTGRSVATDIIKASVKAYVAAINKTYPAVAPLMPSARTDAEAGERS